jgi:hypothetical protein
MLEISDIKEQKIVVTTRIEECKKNISFWVRDETNTKKELLVVIYFEHFLNSDTKTVKEIQIGSLAVFPSLLSDSNCIDFLEETSLLIDDVLLTLFKKESYSEIDRNNVSDKIFAIIEDFIYAQKIYYPQT